MYIKHLTLNTCSVGVPFFSWFLLQRELSNIIEIQGRLLKKERKRMKRKERRERMMRAHLGTVSGCQDSPAPCTSCVHFQRGCSLGVPRPFQVIPCVVPATEPGLGALPWDRDTFKKENNFQWFSGSPKAIAPRIPTELLPFIFMTP